MLKIVQIGDPALRKISKNVSAKEIKTGEIKKLLEDLSESLRSRDDGVGLSAPQIAINKRVFVVSGKVFDKNWLKNKNDVSDKLYSDQYFINPVIIKKTKKLSVAEEGCLSIPNLYGNVKRPVGVTIEYLNESGEKQTKKATGFVARIFQHEIDHLDGILFTDKATDIVKLKNTKENDEL